MWTPAIRRQQSRDGLRHEADLTEEVWRLTKPILTAPCARGRPHAWQWREIVDVIFFVLRGGIDWRLLPSDFPPWRTVHGWFSVWRDEAVFDRINHAVVMADRERAGRAPRPVTQPSPNGSNQERILPIAG